MRITESSACPGVAANAIVVVNAQLDVQLDGLVELGAAGLADELKGLLGLVKVLFIYELGALFVILTSEQFDFLLKMWFVGVMRPYERRRCPPTYRG